MPTTTLPDEVCELDIRTLHLDPAFQARPIDDPTVEDYIVSMRNGAIFPPIVVGIVDGVSKLLCGWHRVAAAMDPRSTPAAIDATRKPFMLSAKVLATDARTAQLIARMDNLTHGLKADGREVREAFRSLVRAKQHMRASGAFKTYGEIAADFVVRSVTTLHKWMRSDFPAAARAMGGGEKRGGGGIRERPFHTAEQSFHVAIQQAGNAQRGCLDPEQRGKMIEAATELLEAVKKGGQWTPSDF